jgi:ABC-type nitrate/sulfonate/bicarbonate transport system substrate-binding protein
VVLKLVVFEGVQNLPLFAAQENGIFARYGLEVDITFTPNSWQLRDGLAQGDYHIAHTAVDNAIAMVELAQHDVAVVLGGDNGFNAVFCQPGIQGWDDLRGKTVLVDAPNTAFALVLYRILQEKGLGRGDYMVKSIGATPFRLAEMQRDPSAAAAILNLPYRLLGERAGLRMFGDAVDLVGPYLSTAGFVMRRWASANGDLLVRYIQSYVEGLRWFHDPCNQGEAVALLVRRLGLADDLALDAYRMATEPGTGMARDARLDLDGLENVLRIRAAVSGVPATIPSRYLDLSYYETAIEGLPAAGAGQG